MAADGWGIDDGWWSSDGTWHGTDAATRDSLRAAMGARPDATEPPAGPGILIARPGERTDLLGPARLVLEDGTDVGTVDHLAPDVPLGIHALHGPEDDVLATVLAGPGRCHLPEGLRTWGLVAQVPTSRSRGSWGIGDLADVRALATWIAGDGGGALGLSPLHAPTPMAPLPASPYSPSSRRWRSPLLLRVDELPGAAADPVVSDAAAAARALLAQPLVDRDRCWSLQRAALEHLWGAAGGSSEPRLAAWRREAGPALEGWARYCALAEVHGPTWPDWPEALRRPDAAAVADAARPLAERVAFHAWLQLLIDDQLAAVGAAAPDVRLVQDLAVGADPGGADAWLHQDLLALGASIGAPPDEFAPDGQVWGLPPFVPWKLRAVGYRPLAELLRAAMAHGGGLRVDHVMGLTRLFWVPAGRSAAQGGYVRFAGRELLELLALESARVGAVVVGEDLGTVEPELREDLAAAGVLSTRVVWFEDEPPWQYPAQSEGVVTTHDLPTIAGVWTGADDAELATLDRPAPPDATAEVRERLHRLVELDEGAPAADVVPAVHRRLSEGASMLVLGTLEDLCGVEHRPNVPGTTTERPNWSQALPVTVDDLPAHEPARRAIAALAEPRRPHATG